LVFGSGDGFFCAEAAIGAAATITATSQAKRTFATFDILSPNVDQVY